MAKLNNLNQQPVSISILALTFYYQQIKKYVDLFDLAITSKENESSDNYSIFNNKIVPAF